MVIFAYNQKFYATKRDTRNDAARDGLAIFPNPSRE